jgi:hypothetical protein
MLIYFDSTNWRPIKSAVTTQSRYMGTITTSALPSDELLIGGITPAAHCLFSAKNATAGSLYGAYLTTGEGTITLFHPSRAGGIFDVFCSSM